MTFKALKEVLEERVKLLGSFSGEGDELRETAARYEEAKTILGLVNRVTEITDLPPLFSITVNEHGEQVITQVDERPFADPNDLNAGTDTPAAMRARREEAEPGVNRFDPRRC